MGAEAEVIAMAEVIAIGPSQILAYENCLAYPDDWYDFSENKVVIGLVCHVYTTAGSRALAELCCVGLYDVDNHIVTETATFYDEEELERNGVERWQIESLIALVAYPNVTVWFLPNA